MANESIQFSIGATNKNFVATMRQTAAIGARTAASVSRSFNGMAASTAGKLSAIAAGVLSVATAIKAVEGVKKALDLGGELSDLAARTGIAAGNALALQQAFKNNSLEAAQLGPIINKMQKSIQAGSKAFAEMGINLDDLQKLAPDKQFALIGQRINAIQDPAARAAAAMEVFGRSGGSLLALFADTNALATATRELGGQIDILNGKAGAFDTISDKLGNMVPAKLQGFFVGVADSFVAPLTELLDRIEQSDLAGIGQQVGNAVIDAAEIGVRAVYMAQAVIANTIANAMEAINAVVSGFQRAADIAAAIGSGLASGANLFAAQMAEGITSLALDLQTSLQYAFQSVVSFFDSAMGGVIDNIQAGLEFAIQKSLEGLAAIPLLGKQLGLDGFQAQSFDSIRAGYADARAGRQAAGTRSYADMRAENFQNAGWMQSVMSFAQGQRNAAGANWSAAQGSLASAFGDKAPTFSPATIAGFRSEAGARASAAGAFRFGRTAAAPAAKAAQGPPAGVSARYFSQLVGLYGSREAALAALSGAGGGSKTPPQAAQYVRQPNVANPIGDLAGKGNYAGTYGLIRRGDAARRKAEAAGKNQTDPNSPARTNALLEQQNKLLEQNLTVA